MIASARDFSSYVITDPCIGVKDGTCVEVCPVDCIETTPDSDQFFIDPELCIVCEQCVLVCPVEAIYLEHEVPAAWKASIERNAAFFQRAHAAVPVVSRQEADALIRGAMARAKELSIAVTIAVVDRQGNLVASDVVGIPEPETEAAAIGKAYGAAMMERSSAQLTEQLVISAPDGVDRERIVLEAGAIPFGRPYVTGAIGIAGGTPEQAHECARAALVPG